MCINDTFMTHHSQTEWARMGKKLKKTWKKKEFFQFIVCFICIIPRFFRAKRKKYTVRENTMNWIKSQISLSNDILTFFNKFLLKFSVLRHSRRKINFYADAQKLKWMWFRSAQECDEQDEEKCHLINCEWYGKSGKSCDWSSVIKLKSNWMLMKYGRWQQLSCHEMKFNKAKLLCLNISIKRCVMVAWCIWLLTNILLTHFE